MNLQATYGGRRGATAQLAAVLVIAGCAGAADGPGLLGIAAARRLSRPAPSAPEDLDASESAAERRASVAQKSEPTLETPSVEREPVTCSTLRRSSAAAGDLGGGALTIVQRPLRSAVGPTVRRRPTNGDLALAVRHEPGLCSSRLGSRKSSFTSACTCIGSSQSFSSSGSSTP